VTSIWTTSSSLVAEPGATNGIVVRVSNILRSIASILKQKSAPLTADVEYLAHSYRSCMRGPVKVVASKLGTHRNVDEGSVIRQVHYFYRVSSRLLTCLHTIPQLTRRAKSAMGRRGAASFEELNSRNIHPDSGSPNQKWHFSWNRCLQLAMSSLVQLSDDSK